ncbi:MAG: 30S ribosomal protein S15 [Cytophagales bacterium]|nr:30S ribosomal protein S15 [Cytophagales bacterium]
MPLAYLSQEKKAELVKRFAPREGDTGSPEAQVALLTHRIRHLTDHLKTHKKDVSTRLGLLRMVGRRRRLLRYLAGRSLSRYRDLLSALDIRA